MSALIQHYGKQLAFLSNNLAFISEPVFMSIYPRHQHKCIVKTLSSWLQFSQESLYWGNVPSTNCILKTLFNECVCACVREREREREREIIWSKVLKDFFLGFLKEDLFYFSQNNFLEIFVYSPHQFVNIWWCTCAQGMKHFVNPVWQGFCCKETNLNCSIA